MGNKKNTAALLIGEAIEDYAGILRKRTNIKDDKSAHADNYYYIPMECYCDKTFDSSGYTYSDEYGPCDYCKNMARQVNGNNTAIAVDFNDQSLFKG